MTLAEIKSTLPQMVVWMAKKAVMEGVKANHKSQKQYEIESQKEQIGVDYNYLLVHAYKEGVHVASEVLWKVFASCSAECQAAIAKVAQDRDGYCGTGDNYFDDFVNALEQVQGHPVRIRIEE